MIDSDHAVNIRWAKWNGQEITPSSISDGITPGVNNTPIYLGLEERWYGPKRNMETTYFTWGTL